MDSDPPEAERLRDFAASPALTDSNPVAAPPTRRQLKRLRLKTNHSTRGHTAAESARPTPGLNIERTKFAAASPAPTDSDPAAASPALTDSDRKAWALLFPRQRKNRRRLLNHGRGPSQPRRLPGSNI